jgi:hypothetical protein
MMVYHNIYNNTESGYTELAHFQVQELTLLRF